MFYSIYALPYTVHLAVWCFLGCPLHQPQSYTAFSNHSKEEFHQLSSHWTKSNN